MRAYELCHAMQLEPGTAALASNDQLAIGLLAALRERDLRVPEDVSVVGFDDVPEAPFLFPPLTTVRQDFAALMMHEPSKNPTAPPTSRAPLQQNARRVVSP